MMRRNDERRRRNFVAVALHVIWTTWHREPMLTPERERRAYRCITAQAEELGATVFAVNGMPDHVHLIVQIPTTLTIAKLMHRVKGVSSHLLNAETPELGLFRWADGNAVFSMSRSHRDNAIAYVRNQKQHHADLALRRGWEIVPEDDP